MEPVLTLVSNRLPVSVRRVNDKLEFYPSVGGLATGLSSYTTSGLNRWIGWPGIPSEDLSAEDKKHITEELAKHNCHPIFLNKRQIDGFYNGYSNRILWPLFHDIPLAEDARKVETHYWQVYKEVNALFAKTVLKRCEPGSLIWVHDYQLLLLPELLRTERPADKIGFFLHIPFPSAASLKTLPSAKELVGGLLGADLIGLHTKFYVQNFLDSAEALKAGIVTRRDVAVRNRVVRVANFPMGIDYAKYTSAARSRAVQRELMKVRAKYSGYKLILTVDRLEPSKGLVERAAAYREFLRQSPRLHDKVVMVMVVVPSRTDIAEQQSLKVQLEKLIEETNEEFGTPLWQPIDYLYESLPFEKLSALYLRANVAFIAPLRDGMNLVAKEYLASQYRRHGVLVLSQTAGAAQELKDAVIVDPRQPDSLVAGLNKAVSMSKLSWLGHFARMQYRLRSYTVNAWAGDFLKALLAPMPSLPSITHNLSPDWQKHIHDSFKTAHRRLLLLDYDGTLAPIEDRPEEAIPSQELKDLLRRLARLPHTEVVIASGRPKAELTEWFGRLPIGLVAESGAFYRLAGSLHWSHIAEAKSAWKEKLLPLLETYASETPGALVEEKDATLVWHYRLVSPYHAQKSLVALHRQLAPLAESLGLWVHDGKKIVEIQPSGIGKGQVAARWMIHEPDFVLAIGDDYTDEDTFLAVPEYAYTVKVGSGRTTARFRISDVATTLQLLHDLAEAL